MGVAPAAWIVVSSQSLEVDKKRLGDLQEGFLPWEGGQTGLDPISLDCSAPHRAWYRAGLRTPGWNWISSQALGKSRNCLCDLRKGMGKG